MAKTTKLAVAGNESTVTKRRRKKRGRKKKLLTPQQLDQNLQKKGVRALMGNIGFERIPNVDGKHFVYDGRTTELDDIFFYENVILITEYTVGGTPGTHLFNKKVIYDKINDNPREFIKFLMGKDGLNAFAEAAKKILREYTLKQLHVKILYASKSAVDKEHKAAVEKVVFFDYSEVKYFESISKVIKKTTRFEFFEFLGVENSKVGANIKSTSTASNNDFSGHILPEEHSQFDEGYKIVSFYMDANSLLKRAYVLRKDGWRNKDNIGLYQRMFLKKKISAMRRYLHEQKRVFVNNIIVTLSVDEIKLFDDQRNELKLDKAGNFKAGNTTNVLPATIQIKDRSNIIGIIDGQHRSYAYHEGNDAYEITIKKIRNVQNLLVTGILYPKDEPMEKRLKFEAELFLEINANQASASAQLKQDIEFMLTPFSTTSVSKHIVNKLNESGPLGGMFEQHWYEKERLKTSSIINFGFRPLVKFEGDDTLFKIWKDPAKNKLKDRKEDFKVLIAYKEFCVEQVRNVFIGLKANVDHENWKMDRNDGKAVLSVTMITGVINCIRLLVENNKTGSIEFYKRKFSAIQGFDFKSYKSSQYRQMGQAIYNRCFAV